MFTFLKKKWINKNESTVSLSGFLFVDRSPNQLKMLLSCNVFINDKHSLICALIHRTIWRSFVHRDSGAADTGDSALESTDGRDKLPQLNGNKIREGGRSDPTKRVQLQGKGNKSAAAAWTA